MYHASRFLFLAACFCFLASSIQAQQYYYKDNSANATKVEVGDAVYYADYLEGRTTALGEVYRRSAYTAAHRTYKKGTLLKVTRLDNGKSVVVRVNDRGPYSQGVVVDISKAAAMTLGLLRDGRTRVQVEPVGYSETNPGEEAISSSQLKKSIQQERSSNSVYYPTPSQYYNSQDRLTAKGGSNYSASQQNYNTNAQYSSVPGSYNELSARRIPQGANTNTAAGNQTTAKGVSRLPGGTQGYAIQVASFQNMDNANRQVIELQQQGLSNVFLMQKGGLNKVVIAAFPNKFAAQQYLDQLKQQYYVDGIVVMLR